MLFMMYYFELVRNILTYLIMTISLFSWYMLHMYIEEKQTKEIIHLQLKQYLVSNQDMND